MLVVGVNVDVTERRTAEEALNRALADLAHRTRIASMGELTASIAHEVNQPLSAIVTNSRAGLRWLAGASPDLGSVREALQDVVSDAIRASEVIRRTRRLFEREPVPKAPLDLNEVIREALALAHRRLEQEHVVPRPLLADDLPSVAGDRVQLHQVILNLIVNAVDSMSGVNARPRTLVIRSHREGAGAVSVAVCDSGIGLAPDALDRLFDTFYTTKAGGMGMGLSISRSIVEAHGGRLWATPNESHGATFHLTLPAAEGAP